MPSTPKAPSYLGGGYVGSVPGVGLQLEIESAGVPWVFLVVWTETFFSGAGGVFVTPPMMPNLVELYAGNTQCLIVDNLPVLLPFVSFFAGPWSDGLIALTGSAWTSPSGTRGPTALPTPDGIQPSGFLISQPLHTIAAGGEEIFYSPVLAPGPHQLYLQADADDPAVPAFANLEVSYNNVNNLVLAAVAQEPTPIAGIQQAQVLVPNVQPRIRFDNTANTNPADFAGELARPPGMP